MRETIWWVYPKDDWTNGVVATQIKADENAHERVPCKDGKKREMWLCRSYDDAARLEAARSRQGLHLDIYRQRGNAPAEKFSFKKFKRYTRRAHLARAEEAPPISR